VKILGCGYVWLIVSGQRQQRAEAATGARKTDTISFLTFGRPFEVHFPPLKRLVVASLVTDSQAMVRWIPTRR